MTDYHRFEDLEVWQVARQLTRRIYEVSQGGRFARDFGLRDQICRASVSIMSNSAEGFESRTRAMFVDFLGRAKGSAGEVRAQLTIASDIGHLIAEEYSELHALVESCGRQLSRFMAYLESQSPAAHVRDGSAEYQLEGDLPSSFLDLPSWP